MLNLNDFILFDPLVNHKSNLPKKKGNYIVTIRDIRALPTQGCKIVTSLLQGREVIYTGITSNSKGLYYRIGNQHLGDNAGRSTLRLSLGCLLGYTLIPRDKSKPDNGMVRFNVNDELALLKWMNENLLFYFLPNESPKKLEAKLIEELNPPLNLQENYNPVNQEFRTAIKSLRRQRPWRQQTPLI